MNMIQHQLGRQVRCLFTTTQRINQTLTETSTANNVVSPDLKPVIGLEVHAQLNIKSKLFSRGFNSSDAAPNTQLDLFDISLPGTLPKLNGAALRSAILTGLALNCTIQDVIHFDRKNYFYTDMPAGYQLTQYNKPIAVNGFVDFIVTSYHKSLVAHSQQYDIVKYIYSKSRFEQDIVPYIKRSRIKQIQLEQDSAKTLHDSDDKSDRSREINNLVDYNRSGAALIEIVFEPDLSSHHEAVALVQELISILQTLKTCDCELQEGSLRVDANVSIKNTQNTPADNGIVSRVELKNLNSLRALDRGIASEIQRQASLLQDGHQIKQESRIYDSRTGRTILLREKETVVDYRYVPEPSIPPIRIERELVDEVGRQLPVEQLPESVRKRLTGRYDLELRFLVEIVREPGLADYMDRMMEGREYDPNVIADFLIYSINNLKTIDGLPMKVDLTDKDCDVWRKLPPKKMRQIFDMMLSDRISFAIAFEVMKCLFTGHADSDPEELVSSFGWQQITDEQEIEEHCKQLIVGMKNISKKYAKTGQKKYLRSMLAKLSDLHQNRISIRKAIDCLDKLLRPH